MKRRILCAALILLMALGGVTAYAAGSDQPECPCTSAQCQPMLSAVEMSDPWQAEATTTYISQEDSPEQTFSSNAPTQAYSVDFTIYEPFGLRYDQAKKELYFEGELVRYFYDGVDLEDGMAVHYDFLNEKGTVDVHTTWTPNQNADGSTNPFGVLTGIERYSQKEFDNRDFSNFYGSIEAVTVAKGSYDPNARTFTDIFAKYKQFGIEYVEAENASGAGDVYYNGQLVNAFSDVAPEGSAFSFNSANGGTINAQTVYENGILVGVRTTN